MTLTVEKSTAGLVDDSASKSHPLINDATALRNTFRVLCGYCAYLLLAELVGDILQLPSWIVGPLRFIPYCFSLATLAYFARPLLKPDKETMLMAVFLGCLFVVFLTDVTKNLQFLSATPVLGANSRLRREVRDLAEIVAIGSFLIGSYLMILATTRAKLLLSQEVDKLQRAEATLAVSEQKFRSIFEASNAGMFLSDLQGKLLLVNPALTRLLGYTTGEVLGKSLKDFMPPEDGNAEASQIDAVLAETASSVQMEKRYLHQDGHVVWGFVTLALVRQDNGTPLYLTGQIQDITGRREAEDALHRSERRYRLISENTGDVIWTLDIASRRFTYVSPSVQRLRGYTPEEAMAQPIEVALTPESYQLVVSILAERLPAFAAGDKSAGSWIGQIDQPRKDGSIVPTEVVVNTLIDEHGRMAEVLGVSRDITERKRLEEQLRQAQKMEAVGQLAGGVAHDFNNLLTVIQGHCTLLQAEPQGTAYSLESLKEIEDAARRATNLTRQLLTFSRRHVMQKKPLDLNEVLSHLVKMLGRLLGEHIALEFEPQEALPSIVADEGMMEQIVMNLSVNARDAMPKGGRLTLSTGLVELDAKAAEANTEARPGRFVCLTVADTGCGMDLATRKKIFEPFFTTKDVGKGTGLGLATVYGIVKQHQGWTEVESEVGKGTTIRVYLPVTTASAQTPIASSPGGAARGGRETILVVEDEPALRQLTTRCLRRNGYRVLEANNGVEAQAIWREQSQEIALLLTDMVMPGGMTGLELAEQLRTEKNSLKVLVVTGYSLEMSHRAPVGRGITYLEKPYEMAALAVAVRTCLDEA